MRGHLLLADDTIKDANVDSVQQAIDARKFFWLDIIELGDDGPAMLTDRFGFHPLAAEDAEHFDQRPKVDEYDDFFYLVMYGADQSGEGTIEVHFFYSEHSLVTVRRAECPKLDEMRAQVARRHLEDDNEPIMILYRALDSLVDTFFPVLSIFDDRIDELEDAILVKPTEQQLGELFDMKRHLVGLRKVVTAERDMFAGLVAGVLQMPGMTRESERYFRDLYDHLIRVSDLVDSYRDLLTGTLGTHLSTVSNRLNEVMKQLTIIATVFLPLSFITGFFGQNFGWMIDHIGRPWEFIVFGLGIELLAVFMLMAMFRRRGWLNRT